MTFVESWSDGENVGSTKKKRPAYQRESDIRTNVFFCNSISRTSFVSIQASLILGLSGAGKLAGSLNWRVRFKARSAVFKYSTDQEFHVSYLRLATP